MSYKQKQIRALVSLFSLLRAASSSGFKNSRDIHWKKNKRWHLQVMPGGISSLWVSQCTNAMMAQWLELRPLNGKVLSSNPSGLVIVTSLVLVFFGSSVSLWVHFCRCCTFQKFKILISSCIESPSLTLKYLTVFFIHNQPWSSKWHTHLMTSKQPTLPKDLSNIQI